MNNAEETARFHTAQAMPCLTGVQRRAASCIDIKERKKFVFELKSTNAFS